MEGRLETRGLGRLTLVTLRFCELIFSGLLIPILTNNKFSSKSCSSCYQMKQRVCFNSILIIWLQRHSFEFPDMLLEGFHVSIFPETISDISTGYSQIPAFQSLRCYFKPEIEIHCLFVALFYARFSQSLTSKFVPRDPQDITHNWNIALLSFDPRNTPQVIPSAFLFLFHPHRSTKIMRVP